MLASGLLDNPTCRLEALSIPWLLDAIGLFTDEELAATELVRFIAVGLDFATILFSSDCSCILFTILSVQLIKLKFFGAAERAEMTDIEQTKKIIPFVMCEITFGQDVCELMFGINVTILNFGNEINPVKQPIKRNSVGS